MRKVTVHILLLAVLLATVIPIAHAATVESGNNSAATSPYDSTDILPPEPGSDILPPEPGTASDTPTNATVSPSPPIDSGPGSSINAETAGAAVNTSTVSPAKTDVKKAAAGPSPFRGKYFGGKFGINNSSASGTTSAPSASTLAYGLQGGYLQGGYNWDLHVVVAGVGAYVDWNNYALHTNGIAYASRSYGLDAKLGWPAGDWLPYVKVGYGYSTGTRDVNLRAVAQNSFNDAVGFEYNLAPRWSVIAEYKWNHFSNRDRSITISNKLFSFGFNYYFDIPLPKKVKASLEVDLPVPAPLLQPDSAPEAPPPP